MNTRVQHGACTLIIAFACFGFFLLTPSFLQAQESSSQDYLSQEMDLDSSGTASLNDFGTQSSTQSTSANVDRADSSMTWYLFKTLLVLVVLSTAIWGLLKFMKKTGIGGASNPFMSIHSSLALGQSQTLQIVQVGKRFYMLGVTDSQVQLLGEIEDEDTLTDLRLYSGGSQQESSSSSGNGFQDILQNFVGTSQHSFQAEQDENQNETQLSDLRTKIQNLRNSGGEA